jgi:hypothetical protein
MLVLAYAAWARHALIALLRALSRRGDPYQNGDRSARQAAARALAASFAVG